MNQVHEEPTETESEHTKNPTVGARKGFLVYFVVALIVFVATFSLALILHNSLFGIVGPDGGPKVEMTAIQEPEGYEIMITEVSQVWELSDFKVLILTEDDPWPGFPKVLGPGHIGQGPNGEYANFTDLTGDGILSRGDFIALQGLQSGVLYEVVLIWALLEDIELDSESILVP
ncbi:MAG: hypothetical protein V3V91_02015 [Thermoplasmata archaeon]